MTAPGVLKAGCGRRSGLRNALASRGERREGFALAAVILPLLMIALLAVTLTAETRTEIRIARNVASGFQSQLAVDAALYRTILEMGSPGDQRTWLPDGKPHTVHFEGLDLEVSVTAEASKINVHVVPNPPIQRLLRLACASERQSDSLAAGIARALGKEAIPAGAGEATPGAEPPHGSTRSDRLRTLSELRRLSGMTEDLYQRLRPFLTVHGYHQVPELRFAAPQVISATLGDAAASAHGGPADQSLTSSLPLAGLFTIRARVISDGHPPSLTEAIVYITGQRAEPFRMLELRRDLEWEAPLAACTEEARGS